MIKYKCGCINEVDVASGVLKCYVKCDGHARERRDPATLDEAYYRSNGAFDGPHLEQIREALGPFPAEYGGRKALEIGCGVSPYAGAIMAAGWRYTGIDPSPWAACWTAMNRGASTYAATWEEWQPERYGLILAAHVLEHLKDAPAGLAKMSRSLEPGSELWLIVPDDSDPVNPDHLFFFSADTLRKSVERCGLSITVLETRKYIERENFLYLRATKP